MEGRVADSPGEWCGSTVLTQFYTGPTASQVIWQLLIQIYRYPSMSKTLQHFRHSIGSTWQITITNSHITPIAIVSQFHICPLETEPPPGDRPAPNILLYIQIYATYNYFNHSYIKTHISSFPEIRCYWILCSVHTKSDNYNNNYK